MNKTIIINSLSTIYEGIIFRNLAGMHYIIASDYHSDLQCHIKQGRLPCCKLNFFVSSTFDIDLALRFRGVNQF